MSEKDNESSKRSDLQMAALASSVTIIVFFVVYWSGQIQSTLELLEMAYG